MCFPQLFLYSLCRISNNYFITDDVGDVDSDVDAVDDVDEDVGAVNGADDNDVDDVYGVGDDQCC